MKHLLRFKQLLEWGVVVTALSFVNLASASEGNPLRDPTQPENFQPIYVEDDAIIEDSEVTLNLQAVFSGKESSRALINGVVLKKGDAIEGFVVRSISPYRVELEGEEDTARILTLFVESFRE